MDFQKYRCFVRLTEDEVIAAMLQKYSSTLREIQCPLEWLKCMLLESIPTAWKKAILYLTASQC